MTARPEADSDFRNC